MSGLSRDLAPVYAVCAHCETDSSLAWHTIGGKDYCDECIFYCEAHGETLPAGERSGCGHFTICRGCAAEDYCVQCSNDDRFYDEVDRQYAMSKEGY